MILGDDLKRMRVKAKLTETAMAKKMRVSRKTVQNWESDVGEPRVSQYLSWLCICRISAASHILTLQKRRKGLDTPTDLTSMKIDKDND
jgi:DNA-binding XRE family transcriptional regulator